MKQARTQILSVLPGLALGPMDMPRPMQTSVRNGGRNFGWESVEGKEYLEDLGKGGKSV